MIGTLTSDKSGMREMVTREHAPDRMEMRFSRPELSKAFGKFCQRLMNGDCKGLTPLTGSEGGYLVPDPEVSAEISRMVSIVGVAARIGRPVPMGAGGFSMPRRLGGAVSYWKTGGVAVSKSTPSFGRLTMRPETLMSLVDVDVELEEDAVVAFGNFMATEFAYALAYREDQAAFAGDGSPTYGGITGIVNSDRVTLLTAASTCIETWLTDQWGKIEGAIWEGALQNASWLCSRSAKAAIRYSVLGTTGAGAAWWSLFIQPGQPGFMGYPMNLSGFMSAATGATAPSVKMLAFGDFAQGLLIGRRGQIAVDYSPAPGWTTLQNCWRAYERVNIAVNGFTAAEIAEHPELANPIVVVKNAASN
jgi:HK97 family phage major capsid protein